MVECTHCAAVAAERCSACKTPYCSIECSKISWPTHKQFCKKSSAQQQLALKTARKISAFLHGSYRFEDRDEAGKIVPLAELQTGIRYNVYWEWEGEVGEDLLWKFRGSSTDLACTIPIMEESMMDESRNCGLLRCASSNWAQTFYDMIVNFNLYGTVLYNWVDYQAQPGDESNPHSETYQIRAIAGKWDRYLARAQGKFTQKNQLDIACMFWNTREGCLAPKGTCLFAHLY